MTTVSSQEFVAHQDKYFDIAIDDDVCIERVHLMYKSIAKEQAILQPDDDLRRAISGQEFKKRALEIVEKVHNQFALLKPDDDFRRAITMDEFKERALLMVDKLDKKYALLKPDDDLRRAITVEELLEGIHEDIRRKYASRV